MHNVSGESVIGRPSFTIRPDRRSARFGRRAFLLAAGSALLAGCVEEEGARQFANDPRPTSRPETPTVVVTPPPPPPTLPVAAARPLADLLRPRGAPARVYFRAGRELWTIGADGAGVARLFAPPAGATIADVSASPSGDRVAVLVQSAAGAEAVVFDAAGTALLRAGNLGAAFGAPGVARTIDWSPQGGELVVGLDPGGLLVLPLEPGGQARVIAAVDGIGAARWSPTGEAVAFEAIPVGEGYRELIVIDAAAETLPLPATPGAATPEPMPMTSDAVVVDAVLDGATPGPATSVAATSAGATPVAATPVAATPTTANTVGRPVVPARSDRAVFGFAWMPDGRSLVFAEGGVGGDGPPSADLWRVTTPGGDRSLLASAGSVAPVARVGIVAPSPDGAAVAYAIEVPDGDVMRFHSLWVLELASRQAERLDVPAGSAVREVWWTDSGLLYRAEPETTAGGATARGFALYRVAGEGAAEVVFQAVEAATPAASPGSASPAASPVATPQGEG